MYDQTPGYDGKIDPRAFWGGDLNIDYKERPKVLERIRAFYDAKVSHFDRWFGEFLDTLEETGLDQNTAIVLTADHGACVGETGVFAKRIYKPGEWEGHVPMMVYVPGKEGGHDQRFVQPQDIAGTILGLAGISMPPEMDGMDMLSQDLSKREVAVMGYGDYSTWKDRQEWCLFTILSDKW